MNIPELRRVEKEGTKAGWEWKPWEMGLQLQSSAKRDDGTDPEDWPVLLPKGCGNNDGHGCSPNGTPDDPHRTCPLMPSKQDRELICAARNALPALLDMAEAGMRLAEAAREAESVILVENHPHVVETWHKLEAALAAWDSLK